MSLYPFERQHDADRQALCPRCEKPLERCCCIGPAGSVGTTGATGATGPVIGAAASLSSHTQQTFTPPLYGSVSYDSTGALHNMSLAANNQFVIVETAELYLIEYGVMATTGTPGLCTIAFAPGGHRSKRKNPAGGQRTGNRFHRSPYGCSDTGKPASGFRRQQQPCRAARYHRLLQCFYHRYPGGTLSRPGTVQQLKTR